MARCAMLLPHLALITGLALAATITGTAHAQTPPASTVADPAGPLERRAVPIAADNPLPRRGATLLPEYPDAERAHSTRGTVTLRVTVDESGHVREVRQPFQPDLSVMTDAENRQVFAPPLGLAFVKAATSAVAEWQYDPPARGPIAFYVRLHFDPDRPAGIVWHDARPPQRRPGDGPSGVPGGIPGGVVADLVTPRPVPPPPPAPIRVGGTITPPRKIKDVKPVYPAVAQSARVQGIVILEITVGVEGRVRDAHVLRSISLLDQAALDAVRQWEFTPTLLNGKPVAMIMSVTVNFNLTSNAPPPASEPAGDTKP